MANVVVVGGDELVRKLKLLEGAVRGAALVAAAERGAEPVRDMAGQLAPVGLTGDLASSMKKAVVRSDANRADVAVGPTALEGLFQELGTVHHPAQAFLRPALDSMEREVISEVGQELRERLLKVAGRGS